MKTVRGNNKKIKHNNTKKYNKRNETYKKEKAGRWGAP